MGVKNISGSLLRLLQVNDTHAYLETHPELFWVGYKAHHQMAGGYGRLKTAMERLRDDFPGQTLAIDCGDTIHGTYPAVVSKGEVMIPILNEMGFSAMTGHWEFAYGPEQFKKITGKLNYPMLALNCYSEKNDKLIYDPYTITEVGDLHVGLVGLAAPIVDKVMPSHFSKGIYFTMGIQEIEDQVNHLKIEEKVDLLVLISHLGFPQDIKLAGNLDGVDIILSSHTHNRLNHPIVVNDTIIIQSGCHGSFLGCLDLEVDDRMVKIYKHKLLNVSPNYESNPVVDEMVNKFMEPHREMLEEKIGRTRTSLNRNTILESTMDNLLLKSLLHVSDGVVAFSNGWRYGAPIPPGPVTRDDLWNIIPTNPSVSTVEVTGRDIWHMLENNVERTFSRNPYHQMGGYLKRCMGLNMYLKIENPPGERVQEIFIKGKKLDPLKTYEAVFVTTQGVPEGYGENRENIGLKAVDALEKYISSKKTVSSELIGTVVAV